jgi:alpha-glucosidase
VNQGSDSYHEFVIQPGYSCPDWAQGSVFYQIFVDRFCKGDSTNDVLDKEYLYVNGIPSMEVKDWNDYPTVMDVGRFYGGDLQGVINKLDYLADLGVKVIYLNPIFVSPSNHKYDIQDYDYVDPHLGVIIKDEGELLSDTATDNSKASRYICRVTSKENLEASNQLFIHLVQEIHKRGMKVILDGVFNHCGSFNKWMDRERLYEGQEGYEPGAYISADSPYRNFFQFDNDSETDWPYNGSYRGWWNYETLPKLNYEGSEQLCQYILDIGKKWVSEPYNADGWRLDVAEDLGQSPEFNHQFWKRFRKAVKEANPNAFILAEHYGDASAWLQGDEWDSVMNYDAFMEPVGWFLTGMDKHSDEYNPRFMNDGRWFAKTMKEKMSRLPHASLLSAMNELSNHDHSRFMTRTKRQVGRLAYRGSAEASIGVNKGIFREGVVIQMTWPGAPTIYYGDEAGVCGWTDPDNRRTYPWGHEDIELLEFHRDLVKLHNQYKALQTGSIKGLLYGVGLLVYSRFTEDEVIIVVVNNLDIPVPVEMPVWEVNVTDNMCLTRIMATNEHTYNIGRKKYPVKDGYATIRVDAYGTAVLKAENL